MSWGACTVQHTSGAPGRVRDARHGGTAVGPRYVVAFSGTPGSGRVAVTVRGEVDWDARDTFHTHLVRALGAAERGVDLYLDGVVFWDCSALNAVLEARQRAVADGKTLALRSTTPLVRRVLELTGTAELLTAAEDE